MDKKPVGTDIPEWSFSVPPDRFDLMVEKY